MMIWMVSDVCMNSVRIEKLIGCLVFVSCFIEKGLCYGCWIVVFVLLISRMMCRDKVICVLILC